MAESPRLMGRNGAIWREYCRGALQEDLALKYKLSQAQISAAIATVADSVPQQERAALIAQEVDFFRELRIQVLELWYNTTGAPVTVGRDGTVLWDPESNEIVRDHTGRLNAVRVAESISARMHKLLGLEASQKVEIHTGEEDATRTAAAEAHVFLHGGTPGEA